MSGVACVVPFSSFGVSDVNLYRDYLRAASIQAAAVIHGDGLRSGACSVVGGNACGVTGVGTEPRALSASFERTGAGENARGNITVDGAVGGGSGVVDGSASRGCAGCEALRGLSSDRGASGSNGSGVGRAETPASSPSVAQFRARTSKLAQRNLGKNQVRSVGGPNRGRNVNWRLEAKHKKEVSSKVQMIPADVKGKFYVDGGTSVAKIVSDLSLDELLFAVNDDKVVRDVEEVVTPPASHAALSMASIPVGKSAVSDVSVSKQAFRPPLMESSLSIPERICFRFGGVSLAKIQSMRDEVNRPLDVPDLMSKENRSKISKEAQDMLINGEQPFEREGWVGSDY